jgi:hypothetical protein
MSSQQAVIHDAYPFQKPKSVLPLSTKDPDIKEADRAERNPRQEKLWSLKLCPLTPQLLPPCPSSCWQARPFHVIRRAPTALFLLKYIRRHHSCTPSGRASSTLSCLCWLGGRSADSASQRKARLGRSLGLESISSGGNSGSLNMACNGTGHWYAIFNNHMLQFPQAPPPSLFTFRSASKLNHATTSTAQRDVEERHRLQNEDRDSRGHGLEYRRISKNLFSHRLQVGIEREAWSREGSGGDTGVWKQTPTELWC